MTLYSFIFYLLGAVILAATAIAVTRHHLVHAVVYLVISFFGSAMLFYLLGAPLLAAMEVIIYAGAIMILFLFIIMMMKVDLPEAMVWTPRHGLPAIGFVIVYLVVGALLGLNEPRIDAALVPAVATPRNFGRFLFDHHWLTVEIVSLLLLVTLVGALRLGRPAPGENEDAQKENPP